MLPYMAVIITLPSNLAAASPYEPPFDGRKKTLRAVTDLKGGNWVEESPFRLPCVEPSTDLPLYCFCRRPSNRCSSNLAAVEVSPSSLLPFTLSTVHDISFLKFGKSYKRLNPCNSLVKLSSSSNLSTAITPNLIDLLHQQLSIDNSVSVLHLQT